MSRSDHQEPNNTGQGGQDFEPFMLDVSGPGGSGVSTSGSGQFAGAEMEFEPFMFNPGEAGNAGASVSTAPEPPPAAAPSPVPVTGHAVPPPSYLTASAPAPQPPAEAAPGAGNGSSHPQSSPDLSPMMMGRSRGHTGPLAAERLGATPTSWSDSSLASIEDFSAVLIAVQAGRKMLQAGPIRAALPSPAAAQTQGQAAPAAAAVEQPQGTGTEAGQVPQWAAQGEAGAQANASAAAAAPEAPPPFIAGADPSSPWAIDQPEWASGASHASAPQSAMAAEEEDIGLPPWLTEEAETPVQSAASEMAASEPAVQQAEERPELVSSTFTGTTGVGIQAPESTLVEPALETDEEVAGALQTMEENQSGSLDGEAIEFEGFMFDQGTPAPIPNLRGEEGQMPSGPMAPFNPAQAGPAGMVVDQDAHVEGEPLPFWLNDAAEVEVTPGEGYIQAAEAAAHAGDPLVMGQVTAADEMEDDFADLPPVQPFDFTQLEGEVKEETLGFNTEELIGMSQGERDPMVVTANLEALADLVGGPLPAGIDPRQAKGAAAAAEPVDVSVSEPELVIPEEEGDAATSEAQPLGTDFEDAGWMSTVTTDLAASGLVEPTAALPATPVGTTDSTGLSGVLGVSPFDINALDVEEESSTSVLDRIATVGPDTDKLEGRQVSGGHATSPRMDEEYEGDDAETATSIFAQPMSELDGGPDEYETPTSRLATGEAREGEPASPAPEQPEAGVFKARVAGGRWTSSVPQVTAAEAPRDEALHSPWDGGRTGMGAGEPAVAEAQAPEQAVEQEQEQEYEPAFEMPRPGDTTVSGPLPVLTGYEDLVELMEKNPQDIGSYMAMANAYVNSGELESALRVYRRMIKRPGVSATLLNMVDEELEELRSTAGEMPRYHQVRGDLFLKLGRHLEAIDEYNKLV
jgi:pentatricopeptide repeat protein